jgi:hypothetical protein
MELRFFRVTRWGGSRKLAVALLSTHIPSKNPPPISGMQAYIAYLLGRWILCKSAPSRLGNEPRNVCLDA